MTGCKNKLFAAFLSLFSVTAANAQEAVYLIPPVQLLPLKRMETNAYGLSVGAKTDVLNDRLWKNAAYPITASKFAKISANLPAAAEKLRYKLLTLTAEPPQGTTGQSFITLKLEQLFSLGYFDEAYRLLRKIPEKIRTDEQNALYTRILLLTDMQAACFSAADDDADDLSGQKLAAVCAAFNQEDEKAFTALEIVNEQGGDAFVSAAVEHFLHDRPMTVLPKKVTPFTAAVWRKVGGDMAVLRKTADALWFKKMFVTDDAVPAEAKLADAERLVQNGFLPASKLRQFYQQAETGKNATADGSAFRAQMIRQAAALSSLAADNLQKQDYLKQGMASAKRAGLSYAFAAAAKDVLETLTPDADTLAQSAGLIEAFALSGLNEKAAEWMTKAELVFPASETTAEGWVFTEPFKADKNSRFFIPALENMMAFAEKHQAIDDAFIRRIDRLMLMFKTLDLLPADERWHYSSFAEESPEAALAARGKTVLPVNKPVGDTVLDALDALDGSYAGLLNALSLLTAAGLEREAVETAMQSIDLIETAGGE